MNCMGFRPSSAALRFLSPAISRRERADRPIRKLLQFLGHARGSLFEVQTQLEIAESLSYLPAPDSEDLIRQAESVGRMLNAMIGKFRQTVHDPAT